MTNRSFAFFETAIGTCALVWQGEVLVGVQLPEPSEGAARARIARRFGDMSEAAASAPLWVGVAIERIRSLLEGSRIDLSDLPLDLPSVGAFEAAVYRIARNIPPGETLTYGEVAARLGDPQAARAVGQALGRNPWPIVVPCHRVTAADGRFGGFSAPGGTRTKLKLLEIEGALAAETLPLFASQPGGSFR